MINNLSKSLVYFLESIYEEIPNEISLKDLKNLMPFKIGKEKEFKKLLKFCKSNDYILIKNGKVLLTSKGKSHLFELRKYFRDSNNKLIKTVAIISLIISFLALSLNALPSAPKVYYSIEDTCPSSLNPTGFFSLHLDNYGLVPSKIKIVGKGNGIGMNIVNQMSFNSNLTKYLEEGFNEDYLSEFMLPPNQYGSSYSKSFGMALLNNSLEKVDFKINYLWTGYLFNIIPIRVRTRGHEFHCCYNKSEDYPYKYNLIDCE